jgi:large subunit ribosomal protein L9
MATEVLLMTNVPNLGTEGEVVQVADGYARNYLFPKKMGAPVTAAAKARLQHMQAEREVKRQEALSAAQALADRLRDVSCTIAVKTGEDEKLYGSVTAADIAASVKEQGIELDRHVLDLEHPIKELGVFDVKLNLHPDVEAALKVWVVEE